MEELWRWEAIEIAGAVRTQQISSREAVSAYLERIEQVNPRVNAVIELRPEEALAAADAADAAIARGEHAPKPTLSNYPSRVATLLGPISPRLVARLFGAPVHARL
jgi:Asp-tRNA(Asn)/Glu-tRNA(Gln) amidotransferase A subunit family amidase